MDIDTHDWGFQMAIAGEHPCAAAVVAYLREAEGLSQVQNGDQDCKNQNSEGQNCSALKKVSADFSLQLQFLPTISLDQSVNVDG